MYFPLFFPSLIFLRGTNRLMRGVSEWILTQGGNLHDPCDAVRVQSFLCSLLPMFTKAVDLRRTWNTRDYLTKFTGNTPRWWTPYILQLYTIYMFEYLHLFIHQNHHFCESADQLALLKFLEWNKSRDYVNLCTGSARLSRNYSLLSTESYSTISIAGLVGSVVRRPRRWN